MGKNSKIAWTHHTFNPWGGCTKVSPGCDNCYAEAETKRYCFVEWGARAKRRKTTSAWKEPPKWAKAARAVGERHRVFCASWADWLDNKAPQEWRKDLAELIQKTPELDWLLLTKRVENYHKLAPWTRAPNNAWLGVTSETQYYFDKRWEILKTIDAVVRFVSYEPALGPLSLRKCKTLPDWVVCGGESGVHFRPMDMQWARD